MNSALNSSLAHSGNEHPKLKLKECCMKAKIFTCTLFSTKKKNY